MARSNNNLNAVLKDTADAIRVKKGTSEPIVPRDFADEIEGIQAGGGGEELLAQLLTCGFKDFVVPSDVGIKGDLRHPLTGNDAYTAIFGQNNITNIDFNNVRIIPDYTFYNGNRLKNAVGSNVVALYSSSIFLNCREMENLSFPECVLVRGLLNVYANNFNFPKVVFMECSNIKCSSVFNAPNLVNIGGSGFYGCSTLFEISVPLLETLNRNVFNCSNLTTIYAPFAKTTGDYAFHNCYLLSDITAPYIFRITSTVFANCSSLSRFSAPLMTSIGSTAFSGCTSLQSAVCALCFGYVSSANINQSIGSLYSSAFFGCNVLESLYILGCHSTNVPTLQNINVFFSTPMSDSSYLGHFGSIYVPSTMVASFKAATNWATYSDRITALPSEFSSKYVYANEFFGRTDLTAIPSEKLDVEWVLDGAFGKCYSITSSIYLSKCKAVAPEAFAFCSSITSLDLPECEFIGSNAFYRCRSLFEVNLPKVKYIGAAAFSWCGISTLNLPECLKIEASAFSTTQVSFISAPKLKMLSNQVFYEANISSYYMPEVMYINGPNIFGSRPRITKIDFPNLRYVSGNNTFATVSYVTEINLPALNWVEGTGFITAGIFSVASFPKLVYTQGNLLYMCSSVTKVSMPCFELANGALFTSCGNLDNVYLPNFSAGSSNNFLFQSCTGLKRCCLPALQQAGPLFSDCTALESLYLFASNVAVPTPSEASRIFSNTPIDNSSYLSGRYGSIYVPAVLLSDYQNHSVWGQISDRFVGLTDEEMQSIIDHWDD